MGTGDGDDPRSPANRGSGMGMITDCRRVPSSCMHLMGSRMSPRLASVAVITRGRRVRIVASVYWQRSALQVRSRHRRRRRRRRQCHCLRRSWHDSDVEGSRTIASQTPIDVYSGDEGAHCMASETCMPAKDAEIMRQNARFRSSWEPGGDLKYHSHCPSRWCHCSQRRHRTLPTFADQ